MTPVDLNKKMQESTNVVFHRFILISGISGSDTLYCFFEGKDDSAYYLSRIRTSFQNIHPINCNNRSGVIAIFERLKDDEEYDQHKKAFFIDRDFNLIEEIESIYITPTYSIENLYCTEQCFENILRNEFHLQITDSDYQTCMKLFQDRINEFNESVLLLNAWYYCLKTEGECHASLGANLPPRFINWDFQNGISRNYKKSDIEQLFPNERKVHDQNIDKATNLLKERNLTDILRGKYEIIFLRKILRFLINDGNNSAKQNFLKRRVRFNFQDNLILSQLSQYADTRQCLTDYITNL